MKKCHVCAMGMIAVALLAAILYCLVSGSKKSDFKDGTLVENVKDKAADFKAEMAEKKEEVEDYFAETMDDCV